MDYHILREIADSWVLLAMFVLFLGVVVWALRPGAKKDQQDSAAIPFRHENAPARDDKEVRP